MTPEEARTVLLERELDQAAHTISFLHGCLTDDGYQYAYPEQTARHLERIRALVPEGRLCVHSVMTEGCAACVAGARRRALWAEAESVVSGVRSDTTSQGDER